ncbi:hypothetical protein BZG36_02811 [Bifiguratus adelaidae]|uniref:Coatomer subunit zeta n=1 Tax=Bifiguratus adelaidae TaxID=1938954 RepID=A0A261Y1G5_9FUNG|nr:hypothetical protein BZG36_02811 [Bifiguratus adelaidae]
MANLTLYTVKAVLILDSQGNRIVSKFYDKGGALPWKTVKDQKNFEKGLFDKTKRANAEIILYDNQIVLYRSSVDVFFYIVGAPEENELMLNSVMTALYDSISILLRHQVEKRSILDNLDLVVLAVDEIIDEGIILDTDAEAIASRVSKPRIDSVDIPITDQTPMQILNTAIDRMSAQLLR